MANFCSATPSFRHISFTTPLGRGIAALGSGKTHGPSLGGSIMYPCQMCLNLQVLERGSSSNPDLNLVAISLSGFNGDSGGLWKKMVRAHAANMSDPYVRATFEFLTSSEENEEYEEILGLDGIELADKVRIMQQISLLCWSVGRAGYCYCDKIMQKEGN
jgi:hypothetical protein